MPPFLPGTRKQSQSPAQRYGSTSEKSAKKPTLFDAADERPAGSLKANEDFLSQFDNVESDTSLSDVGSAEFEDVALQPDPKRRKLVHHADEEEEIDWEDAVDQRSTNGVPSSTIQPTGDLELTLHRDTGVSFAPLNDQKKGPSKIERQIRVVTHCVHVQFLLFHNSLRSRFACDAEVQKTLVDQLPPVVKKEVDTWRLASGLPQDTATSESAKRAQPKGRKGKTGKGEDVRSQRDWGKPAERQEKGAPNMSRGDPVLRLLKLLAAYWKKRFTITAPGLRKQGYKSLTQLESEMASFKNDVHNDEEHGERLENLSTFRDLAKKCEGSRDVGVQLFVALLRGLGLEVRLVASLQPIGFGWNKNEEANPKKKRVKKDVEEGIPGSPEMESRMKAKNSKPKPKPPKSAAKKKVNAANGSKSTPFNLSDASSSELSSAGDDDDDESVVDVTPSTPRKKPNMPYDWDLVFPTYWAEVISPITNEVYPVDPFILTPAVATSPEHLAAFEPRGTKADKAQQVFAYVIAYSPDGSAKEVTTRYLKKHMWPGRTKGVRLPVEKVPIYNSKGKIKHHEEYDWFKTVMSGYTRPDHMRTLVDDIEEAKDLKAVKPEKKKEPKANEGTLQFYKTSADYVLERHLRREEAIIPGASPIKTFTSGKGDDTKEEPVFLRKDVMVCRTGESWHKEGRQIKAHQQPMKMVPIRAVTLTRKREVQEAERDGGEKMKQGLYAWDQTEWIIPPPIVDGVIPKNAYGNMDCFVPTMVPEGAVHIPLRSTGKICKRLNIDFAEAVTGFEFGKQRAVPVITGVVVAKEHEEMVIEEWEKDEEERKIKEEGKREKVALGMWRKLMMGLRIVERVRDEYGEEGGEAKEEFNPFTNRNKQKTDRRGDQHTDMADSDRDGTKDEDGDEMMAGGFLPDGAADSDTGGGFLPDGYDENESVQSSGKARDLEITAETDQKRSQITPSTTSTDQDRSSAEDITSLTNHTSKATTKNKKAQTPKPKSKKFTRKSMSKADIANDNDPDLKDQPSQDNISKSKRKRASKRQSLPASTPARRAPRRAAAQQSEKTVRSHYFDNSDSEEEE